MAKAGVNCFFVLMWLALEAPWDILLLLFHLPEMELYRMYQLRFPNI